ncbi:MAG: IS200/IS605 family transposase [Hormoscilla sp. GUM202]|nr:IS200/IS605 family transposase [Hormoscilla sp. GUM202]
MAFWRLYYHLVWATKERRPLIEPKQEPGLYNYIIGKADALGCIAHAIGGIEDHIHLVVSIPPKLSIADFVKNIKGSSAYQMNHLDPGQKKFGWQDGYGVFSMGKQQLDTVIAYVQNQKEHHSQGTEIASLEKMIHIDDRPQRQGFNTN